MRVQRAPRSAGGGLQHDRHRTMPSILGHTLGLIAQRKGRSPEPRRRRSQRRPSSEGGLPPCSKRAADPGVFLALVDPTFEVCG